MNFIKDVKGQPIGITRYVLCIGKNIKSTGRLNGNPESHFLEPSNHKPPAVVIDLFHSNDFILAIFKCGDTGLLDHGVC